MFVNRATSEVQKKYIQVLLRVGVNLQPGQKLLLTAEPCHWDFLNQLTREAYAMGASFVLVESQHVGAGQARLELADKNDLGYQPPWLSVKHRTMIDEGWANLSFFGSEDPDAFKSIDATRMAIYQLASRNQGKAISDACGAAQIAWCRAALPTEGWASKVFPDLNSVDGLERLWIILAEVLRLNNENPVASWREHTARIKRRGDILNTMQIRELRFHGGGTDLVVPCLEQSRWIGGAIETPEGVGFVPNLPTEEIFTTPDCRSVSGRAIVVRPVEVLGIPVVGAWFEFEGGKVVRYGAKSGENALDRYFEICPQSRYLGEVALVDTHSPIYQSGLIFHSILYDENATSHIALGSGYPLAIEGGVAMNKEELQELGVNVSLVHTDFMIGSVEVDVDALTSRGELVPILRQGRFVEAFS